MKQYEKLLDISSHVAVQNLLNPHALAGEFEELFHQNIFTCCLPSFYLIKFETLRPLANGTTILIHSCVTLGSFAC